ncbi:MAG: phosphoribosylaminoimidazolesuccinocarboxamide synthase [Bacteroidales bacterium]|nr:phosphoribosylaminoimidazolesuccinocarboxamide synthase [Bacteroidales bacterium]
MKELDFTPRNLIYEGKSKQIFAVDDPDYVIIRYKDDASAYNGIKRAQITNKGVLNNKISSIIYQQLEKNGIKTHFVKRLNDREQLCRRKNVIPIEFVARNRAAGSMAIRLGLKEGFELPTPIFEMCYKNDELDDPIINYTHAIALGLSDSDTIEKVKIEVMRVNDILTPLFAQLGVTLVDFKTEFGKLPDGTLVLADELSPDTCRLWDADTNERLDRDRFRRDLGRVAEAYGIILSRLEQLK